MILLQEFNDGTFSFWNNWSALREMREDKTKKIIEIKDDLIPLHKIIDIAYFTERTKEFVEFKEYTPNEAKIKAKKEWVKVIE